MMKKRDIVTTTAALNSALTNMELPLEGDVLLRSDEYAYPRAFPVIYSCLTRCGLSRVIPCRGRSKKVSSSNISLLEGQFESRYLETFRSLAALLFLQQILTPRVSRYLQLGCDLRDLDALESILLSAVNLEESQILFVAEVSITYMDCQAADALIRWAGKLSHSEHGVCRV
jgi:hypothetical protein